MIEGGGCDGVVEQVAGGWGVVHRVGKALKVWGWKGRGGGKVWTHSATSVMEEVCVAPLYRRVKTQPAWRGVRLGRDALTRGQTMGGPNLDDTEVGVLKDPPDQIRAIESDYI